MASTKSATPPKVVPIASLLAVAAVGWALTGDRMDGMDQGPGTELGGLGWFMVSWVLMMAAMMLPSLTPAALSHARAQFGAVPAFVVGYLGQGFLATPRDRGCFRPAAHRLLTLACGCLRMPRWPP